jgi:hypothetical protein
VTDAKAARAPRRDLIWLALLAAGLLGLFVWPTLSRSYRVGTGSDFPVYLWWARVGAQRGLSIVGTRPGTPALITAVSGALHIPLVPTVAGLQYAIGAAAGLASAAIVRGRVRGPRTLSWVLPGALAGIFATHVGGGYLSTLAFVVPFLAAIAALASGTSRGVAAAALLLGGGALSHPLFFVLGAAVLGLAAVWASMDRADQLRPARLLERDEGRVAASLLGGGALAGAGLLAMLSGPPGLSVDTSKDAFLRRIGLVDVLRHEYRERFRGIGFRVDILTEVVASAAGVGRIDGLARRVLTVWAAVTVVGVPVGLLSGWFPPVRLITFAFALPILTALGVLRVVAGRDGRPDPRGVRVVAVAVATGIVLIATVPQLFTWRRTKTYSSPEELNAGNTVARVATMLPLDTPLVFVVGLDTDAAFHATNDANLMRATLPPDRADDVYVFAGSPSDLLAGRPTNTGDQTEDRLSRDSLEALPDRTRAIFIARPFLDDPAMLRTPGFSAISPDVAAVLPSNIDVGGATPSTAAEAPAVEPSSPLAIAGSTFLLFLVLGVAGFGWARWAFGRWAAVATAPAFGVAMLTLSAVGLERAGLPLTGSLGPTIATLAAALAGYLLLLVKGAGTDDPRP